MRRSTAIALVILGGGTVGLSTLSTRKCHDAVTGQEIACPSSGTGGHGSYAGGSSQTGASATASSVARGGFGGAGASASGEGS